MLRTCQSFLPGLSSAVALLSLSAGAFAQDEAPATAEVQATGSTDMGMTLPAAEAAPGGSDHSQMVGRLAIGYLGKESISLRAANDTSAPVIGVRYWLDDFMGVDAGLGLLIASGSVDTGPTDTDTPSSTAFILHGGLPLSLASSGHFSFQVVPELNIGFASGTNPGDPEEDVSGFRLELGARAGSEIHFGFIGIPELALQAGIGLGLALDSFSSEVGDAETSTSSTTIRTSVNNNPWNIFTSNISALYYF